MTQYMNKAAVDSWVDAGNTVKSRLKEIFRENGMAAETVDAWTNQIIRNTFETAPEPQSELPREVA
ncbi:hypothetical protein [Sinorhizobium alkalisoli]|nr:hypothetical protein [Sinorhizobium alkalisoli]